MSRGVDAHRAAFRPVQTARVRAADGRHGKVVCGKFCQDGELLPHANRNFDTGAQTKAGRYSLADKTYAQLVERLAKERDKGSSPPAPLLSDIHAFYADPAAPIDTKKHRKEWTKLTRSLERLK
jgi:hypothetical protein